MTKRLHTEVTFDSTQLKEWVTGFRKRKLERKAQGHELARRRLKQERQQFRKERRDQIKKQLQSANLDDDDEKQQCISENSENDERETSLNEVKFEDAITEVTVTTQEIHPSSSDEEDKNTYLHESPKLENSDQNGTNTKSLVLLKNLKYKNDRNLPNSKAQLFMKTSAANRKKHKSKALSKFKSRKAKTNRKRGTVIF